jgi:formylglycine-generating enzyme required for sulfatase activity
MAGNVDEWCHDAHEVSTAPAPVTDPVVEPTSAYFSRVVRGGSWTAPAGWARAARRAGASPVQRLDFRGFRCARSL